MTALAMDVRELGFDEIDAVSGGVRSLAFLKFVYDAVRAGIVYDVAVAIWDYAMDSPVQDGQDPYTLAKIG